MNFDFALAFIWGIALIAFTVFIINGMRDENRKEKREIERKKQDEEKRRKELEETLKKLKEDAESKRVTAELDKLAILIRDDWNASIYPDKIITPGGGKVHYQFENGDYLVFEGKDLTYTTHTRSGRIDEIKSYTLGLISQSRFRSIFNRLVTIINEGKTASRRSYTHTHKANSRGYGSYSSGYSAGKTSTKSTPVSDNPKQRRYDILMETITLRKESLRKMKNDDPDKKSLQHELEVAEKKASEIKRELNTK